MAVKVGINGFGRIGRNIMRAALGDKNIDFVAVNDLTNAATLAHLLKYDSVLGNLHARSRPRATRSRSTATSSRCCRCAIRRSCRGRTSASTSCSSRPGSSPTATTPPSTSPRAPRRSSSPRRPRGPDFTVVLGVNDEKYDPAKHQIISNASCTTNCLAPLAKVLHQRFGIRKGWMTTIHSYTNDQQLLDLPHKDLRRARAAALSMIPTTTGAAVAVGEVLPELKGALDGFAMRVPTPNVSVVDLAAIVDKKTTAEEVNAALKEAADGALKGILAVLDRGARVDRLQGQPALVDRRRAVHQGDGRRFREGPLVVRQRVGLLEPLRRSAPAAGEERACEGWLRRRLAERTLETCLYEALHQGPRSQRQARLHPRRFQRADQGRP